MWQSLIVFAVVAMITSSCSQSKTEVERLELYTVRENKFEGGSKIVIAGTEIGHIAPKPEFVATNLLDCYREKTVSQTEKAETKTNGALVIRKTPPRLAVIFASSDIDRFTEFTKQGSGKHVVIMLGGKVLGVTTVGSVLTNGTMTIPYTSEEALEAQRNDLKRLIR